VESAAERFAFEHLDLCEEDNEKITRTSSKGLRSEGVGGLSYDGGNG
jgi:hypothetical protein